MAQKEKNTHTHTHMDADTDMDALPGSFYCPLTQDVMTDPVIDPEGNSYERVAITDWLKRNATSPITRNPLSIGQLTPNRALKDLISSRIGGPLLVHATAPPASAAEESMDGLLTSKVAILRSTSAPGEACVVVSIQPPEGVDRAPVDVCCVVDVSGSMGNASTVQGIDGQTESHGLSVLDVVKHALRTVIAVLEPTDRFALVAFSSKAVVTLGLTSMNTGGKAHATAAMDELVPGGMTNLWDGLSKGLDVLKAAYEPGRNQTVMLLTDGEPNVIPPRGHIAMLQAYKESVSRMAVVNTFGFGYSLDSELLFKLAREGCGQYAFIPDASFVGTIFVHTLANVLTTVAYNVDLAFEPCVSKGVTIPDEDNVVLGCQPHNKASWGVSVRCGTVNYGQTRHVAVRVAIPAGVSITTDAGNVILTYEGFLAAGAAGGGGGVVACTAVPDSSMVDAAPRCISDAAAQKARLDVVDAIFRAVELATTSRRADAQAIIAETTDRLESIVKDVPASAANRVFVDGLLKDLRGQVTQALSREDWFGKWGRHYLPSLACAHQMQQCNNFKDPGVQFYGGVLFRQIRDKADEAFLKLPSPMCSSVGRISKITSFGSGMMSSSAAPAPAPASAGGAITHVSMALYHNRDGGCVDGECTVMLRDQTTKRVAELCKGDRVLTSTGEFAEVVAMVSTLCNAGRRELCELPGGLRLTAYHPVCFNGKWMFPRDLAPTMKDCACREVFTFVMSPSICSRNPVQDVVVNGVSVAVLGHGIQGDQVASHEYLGTRRVLEDLQKHPGFSTGRVTLQADAWSIRDPATGRICGLKL